MKIKNGLIMLLIGIITSCSNYVEKQLYLSKATIIISPAMKSPVNETAGTILVEEINKRTSLQLNISDNWDHKTIIAITIADEKELYGEAVPNRSGNDLPELKKEGYRIFHENKNGKDILWIIGKDKRGVLYGLGTFLLTANFEKEKIVFPNNFNVASSPEFETRGHQLGYRVTNNTMDAWNVKEYDNYIRENVLLGANSFENTIDFSDLEYNGDYSQSHKNAILYPISPKEMNIKFSELCTKYDVDYSIWFPYSRRGIATKKEVEANVKFAGELAKDLPKLNDVFVPGGDPGHEHPSVVLPYLKKMAEAVHKYHPKSRIWVSLQGYDKEKQDYVFDYITKNNPNWLFGIVNGPQSPDVKEERSRLSKKYEIRLYPDISHNVRCQNPVSNWDQAFALTIGREGSNPRSVFFSKYFRETAPYSNGFVTYSDGVHDDVNRILWSQLGWDSKQNIQTILENYARFFFGQDVALEVSKGILDLEKNWEGPIKDNKVIKKTFELWTNLEVSHPELKENWRWQQLLMRAYYDMYIQNKFTYDKEIEKEVNNILRNSNTLGADVAIETAIKLLNKKNNDQEIIALRQKVVFYLNKLNETIKVQVSVEKQHAVNSERGAILDFIDIPLNNKLWLESKFNQIEKATNNAEKNKELKEIANYETPGKGSYYDNISSVYSKHVISDTKEQIKYMWDTNGMSAERLSTQLAQFYPVLEYTNLDKNSDYIIRVDSKGYALLRTNGILLKPTKETLANENLKRERKENGRFTAQFGKYTEFLLKKELIENGKLKITFDVPESDKKDTYWRTNSTISDIWVLKISK